MSVDFAMAAQERAADADRLWAAQRHCGALYMAGYAVECRLKTLLQRGGRKFPTSGSEGHNLRGLWEAAGLALRDQSGRKKQFLEFWSTNLRYQPRLPEGTDHLGLYEGV